MTSIRRYAIFRKLPEGLSTRVGSEASLDAARGRLKQLAVMFPGDYFIFDSETEQQSDTADSDGACHRQARGEHPSQPEAAAYPASGERRKHARFAMCLPLRLRGIRSDGTVFEDTASTETVSAGGFRCNCTADLSMETFVDVFLLVRENVERLIGRARVVAVETSFSRWRKYSFAFPDAHDDWYLTPSQHDLPEGADRSQAHPVAPGSLGREHMAPVARYEIFHKLPDRQPAWVESATSLDDAKNRLKQLAAMFPGDYFILDAENACFIIPRDRASGTMKSGPETALQTECAHTAGNPTAETTAPTGLSEAKDKTKEYVPPALRRIRIPR